MNRNEMQATSNWTGRTPRSINEAFGPTESPLLKEAKRTIWPDVIAFLIAAAITVAMVAYALEVATRG